MSFEFYNNYLKVSNYRQLKQLNNDLIEIDNLTITGYNLNVKKMDKEQILINGRILNIEIR